MTAVPVPLPGPMVIVPPCASAMLREIERPRPVPCAPGSRPASRRTKRSNTRSRTSAGMPGPSSSIRRHDLPSAADVATEMRLARGRRRSRAGCAPTGRDRRDWPGQELRRRRAVTTPTSWGVRSAAPPRARPRRGRPGRPARQRRRVGAWRGRAGRARDAPCGRCRQGRPGRSASRRRPGGSRRPRAERAWPPADSAARATRRQRTRAAAGWRHRAVPASGSSSRRAC